MPLLILGFCLGIVGEVRSDFPLEQLQTPHIHDPIAFWKQFQQAPSPLVEEAALRVLPVLPDMAQRRRFLEESFPALANFGRAQGSKQTVDWLLTDSCVLPFRLALWLEYLEQLPPIDQSWGYEILWDTLPGHPQAFDFLRSAIENAIRSEKTQDVQRLEKVQFLFWPLSFSEQRRRELRQNIPCAKRKKWLQIAIHTGASDAVLESIAECPDPYWEALALYQKGKYAQAWQVWQQIPHQKRDEKIENRIVGMAFSPEELVARYRSLYKQTPSNVQFRRFVRTLLQFGKDQEASLVLAENRDPAWHFWKGFTAFRIGKRTEALLNWATPVVNETHEEHTMRLYWLARAGGPHELHRKLEPQKPILAYYQYMSKLKRRNTTDIDSVTHGLAVILRQENKKGNGLWRQEKLPESIAATLALRPYDTVHRTDECVLDLMAAQRSRSFLLLDLWKCPHFLLGTPHLCPTVVAPLTFFPATIPDAEDLIPGRMSGGLYPQPFEKLIQNAAQEFRLPKSLLWAIMQTESSFFPRVISKADAVGLFQVIPPTGHEIARALGQEPFHSASLLLPENAVRFGAWYLRHLGNEFGDNWVLTVAAYNAGPHQVRRWLERTQSWPTDAWVETIPFDETRRYVKLVLGRMVLFARQIGEPPPVVPFEITHR